MRERRQFRKLLFSRSYLTRCFLSVALCQCSLRLSDIFRRESETYEEIRRLTRIFINAALARGNQKERTKLKAKIPHRINAEHSFQN